MQQTAVKSERFFPSWFVYIFSPNNKNFQVLVKMLADDSMFILLVKPYPWTGASSLGYMHGLHGN